MANRPPRFGERYGCFVVVLCLAGLVGGAVLAYRRPALGIPVELALLVACAFFMRYASRREREESAREHARLRAIAPPAGTAYRALLEAEGLGAHLPAIQPLVRPAVRLSPWPGEGGRLGGTRLGGTPDLPAGFSWPQYEGRPLPFLAQLDLAELRSLLPAGALPATGHLFFFAPPLQLTNANTADANLELVIRSHDAPVAYAGPPPDTGLGPFPGCAAGLEGYDDIPELDVSPLGRLLDDDASDRYCGIRAFLSGGGDDSMHKVLGHADSIQGPAEEECESVAPGPGGSPWRLLLQVGSDERLGMMWGDAGAIYFCLREEDLAAGRFDRVVAIMQCH